MRVNSDSFQESFTFAPIIDEPEPEQRVMVSLLKLNNDRVELSVGMTETVGELKKRLDRMCVCSEYEAKVSVPGKDESLDESLVYVLVDVRKPVRSRLLLLTKRNFIGTIVQAQADFAAPTSDGLSVKKGDLIMVNTSNSLAPLAQVF